MSEWVKSLGFGLTGAKPFRLRPERARLAAAMARFEPLVRRRPFLKALEQENLSDLQQEIASIALQFNAPASQLSPQYQQRDMPHPA